MGRLEDIDNAIWSDPEFAELTAPAKLLYFWSFTNSRCNMAGLYKVSKGAMVFETTLSIDEVDTALVELEQEQFVFYDGVVLWVRSRVKHLRQRTVQIAKSIANDLRRLEGHPLVARFLDAYSSHHWLREALQEVVGNYGDFLRVTRGSTDPLGDGEGEVVGLSHQETTTAEATTEFDAHAQIRELFAYWQERCEHPQAKPTRDRLSKVRARLAEGYTQQQIRTAIDGAAQAAFVNDRGHRYDDLELICRNGSKLEDFITRADRPAGGNGGQQHADREVAKWEERARQWAAEDATA